MKELDPQKERRKKNLSEIKTWYKLSSTSELITSFGNWQFNEVSVLKSWAKHTAKFYLSFDISWAIIQDGRKPFLLGFTSLISNENWHSIWIMSNVTHFGSRQLPSLTNQEHWLNNQDFWAACRELDVFCMSNCHSVCSTRCFWALDKNLCLAHWHWVSYLWVSRSLTFFKGIW